MPEAGIVAAAELGLDLERTLLVPDLGGTAGRRWWRRWSTGARSSWCDRPGPLPAQVRQRLEAVLRRRRGVLLITGDWPGVPVRLRVTARRWAGLGDGHGRLRACLAEVRADGRGEAAVPVTAGCGCPQRTAVSPWPARQTSP